MGGQWLLIVSLPVFWIFRLAASSMYARYFCETRLESSSHSGSQVRLFLANKTAFVSVPVVGSLQVAVHFQQYLNNVVGFLGNGYLRDQEAVVMH